MPPRRRRLALALAVAVATPAWAQDAAPQQVARHDPIDLERVVVKATPLPTTAEDITRPVEVLTLSLIHI